MLPTIEAMEKLAEMTAGEMDFACNVNRLTWAVRNAAKLYPSLKGIRCHAISREKSCAVRVRIPPTRKALMMTRLEALERMVAQLRRDIENS